MIRVHFLWLRYISSHQRWGSCVSFQNSYYNFCLCLKGPSRFSQLKTVHIEERICKAVHKPSFTSLCYGRRWSSHRQGGHFIESSTESLIVVNAKDIGVLIRLLYMTPDNSNDIFVVLHISKQAKWATKREVWPIQDVECRFGRGLCQRPLFIHHTFTCSMDVIREFVLVECQKSWTIWSLVNVCIHSLTYIPYGKMSLRQISLWNS